MDNVGTTQNNSFTDEQGQVSSQAEPKDDENNFTKDEIQLAERYSVEPKLIRMIGEIVAEHTEGISQLVSLMQGKQAKQAEHQEDVTETEMPSTGDSFLDTWIQEAAYPEICMAFACVEISWINNALGDELLAALKFKVNEMLRRYGINDRTLDVDTEVMPGHRWVCYARGLRANEEPLILNKPQPTNETTEEPQAEEISTKDDETEDEEPQLLDDPHPMTTIKNWLSKRTYTEKMTAVLLGELLSKDSDYARYGCCEIHYGNNVLRGFEKAVIESSQSKDYLSSADPEEVVMTGLVTSLLFWYA